MLGFIAVFIITYIIGFILGFIDGFTNGGLKYILFGLVILGFLLLVNTFGLGFGTLIFFIIIALLIRALFRYLKGALIGLLSFFIDF